jgi:hypothetical protein
MAFALAVNTLVDALKKPGCPVCRIFRQGSQRALESFLWENVNEPDVRQGILDSYGFCPAHTRVMVARELYTSSLPLGTNIIYEHLGRVVAGELKAQRPGSAAGAVSAAGGGVRRLLHKMGLSKADGPLHPRGECPACIAGNNAAANSLHVLCDELQKQRPAAGSSAAGAAAATGVAASESVLDAYPASDGLCLPHIRAAIELHSMRFPKAVALVIDDAVQRLEGQSKDMKEYIRKNNWAYREEKLTEEEDTAWRKTLTFFTGLPGEWFTYKTEE